MGWKSAKTITRSEAFLIIMQRVNAATDSELEYILGTMGFGEETNLPHFGHSLYIGEVEEDEIEDDDYN